MKKEEIDKIYNELRENTDEEIAKSFIFPGEPLTEEDVRVLKESIAKHRRTLSKEEIQLIKEFGEKVRRCT